MSSEYMPRHMFTQNRKRKAPHGYFNRNIVHNKELEHAHKPFQDIPRLEVNDEKKRAMEEDSAEATERISVKSLYQHQEMLGCQKWQHPLFQKTFNIKLLDKIDEMPNFEQAFMLCILDLTSTIYSQFGKKDLFVGFEIANDDLRDTICLPYRLVSALEPDELHDWIDILNGRFPKPEKISSYEFILNMCFIRKMSGSGTKNIDHKTKSKYHKRMVTQMKYNVAVNNVSSLCLATALKQGISGLDLQEHPGDTEKEQIHTRWLGVDDTHFDLLKEAKTMLENAGIDKSDEFTLDDVKKLQDLYSGVYQIVVFCEGSSAEPLWKGPTLNDLGIIGLQCTSNKQGHWQYIPSLAKYLGNNFYCVLCNVRSKEPANHYNCPLLCKSCKMKNCLPDPGEVEEVIECPDCNLKFGWKKCFDNHKKPGLIAKQSMCHRTFLCHYCGVRFPRGEEMDSHNCMMNKCGHCLSTEGISHRCTLASRIYEKRHFSEKLAFFLVEEALHILEDGSEIMKPIVAMVYNICPACRNANVPSNLINALQLTCNVCSPGGRVKIFESVQDHTKDVDVIAELMHYLTHIDNHKRRSVTFKISKSLNRSLLEYAVREDIVPFTNIYVHQGNVRAMYQRISKTHIIDLFNMLPAESLAELTKAFNIEKLATSNFPTSLLKSSNFSMFCDWPSLVNKIQFEGPHTVKWIRQRSKISSNFFFPDELFSSVYSKLAEFSVVCTTMTNLFREKGDIHIFCEAHDNRTAAHKLYSRKFIVPNTLPLDHMLTTSKRSFSNVAITYLAWRAHSEGIPVDTVADVGEHKIPYTTYSIDGFMQPCEKYPKGLGIDVKGCYWHAHGCPHVPTMILRRELTVPAIRENDAIRDKAISELIGFESLFECEIADLRKKNKEMDVYMASFKVEYRGTDLNLAKYPLRTDIFRLKEQTTDNEIVKKIDLKNIVPYVLKYKEYPVGPYKKHHGSTIPTPIEKTEQIKGKGLYRCKVLAPRNLQIPVLPVRVNGKHMYSLCTACSFLLNHDAICPHTDDERLLIGTWTTFELSLAIQQGYVVREVIGAITWDEWMKLKINPQTGEIEERGFFSGFVDLVHEIYGAQSKNQKITEANWAIERSLIDEIILQGNAEANNTELFVNAGHGMFDVCNYWARRTDYEKTKQTNNIGELWKIIEDPANEIQEITNFGGSRSLITYKNSKSEIGNATNTVLLPLVMLASHARIEQYNLMKKVGEDNMIYIDAEVLIYKDSINAPLQELNPAATDVRSFVVSRIHKYVIQDTEDKQTLKLPGLHHSNVSKSLPRLKENVVAEAEALIVQKARIIDIGYMSIIKDTNDCVKNTEKNRRLSARLWGRIPTETGYCRSIGA